jgi:NAD(P)-dependent dehydrogenase (short-subunit alcohol dehydrogenase family)
MIDKREEAALLAPALRMLLKGECGCVVVWHGDDRVQALLQSEEKYAALEKLFSNDASCGRKGICRVGRANDVEARYELAQKAIAAHRQTSGAMPALVAVLDIGIFSAGATKAGADAVFQDFLAALDAHKPAVAVHTAEQVDKSDKAVCGRAAGKITVVTGSAQGFGRGIAELLAEEGASVVVADINEPLAVQFAAELCGRYGAGRARAVGVDVTKEDSIKNLLIETVLAYGGIDVFISNAGILKAGSLEEMDMKTFELVTKINYSAFFLCAKYAARFMKIQHRFDKEYFSDIIQINSKSGLAGSNRNFAYAGGKFGGIGLVQSFALELVDDNIKVNAICPGNFFEGPLWADPKNGLFAQYLRANKVPGAKTIEDVKRFYENKVPMKRGCSVRDVALAVFYIIEQNYETGQAVPVTGGQVMLR